MQTILLKAFGGTEVEFHVRLTESVLALVHFIIYTPTGSCIDCDIKEIESQLIEVSRTWSDLLHEALLEHRGEAQGSALFHRYESAFPIAYREDFSARHAVYDIDKIEALENTAGLGMTLYRPIEALDHSLRFKLFHAQNALSLSNILPMLENMGVKVTSERSYEIQTADHSTYWIQEFGLVHQEKSLDITKIKEAFQACFAQIWRGEIENDGFNRLVLQAQLTWREIIIFRAYWKYLRQISGRFSQEYVEQALVNNPLIAAALLDLFYAHCDPAQVGISHVESIVQDIEHSLDSVSSLDEDRILRQFLGIILATLRTNYFQLDDHQQPKPYMAFKFDPSRVPDLPEPRPRFEIFVYSPQVEGVHLRGGRVARGGLRWSDRIEDFRTEILGLVKAQMVKNAVIVPVGSKGGFVAKRLPIDAGREAIQAEGIACYQTFIRGLLDLTDNWVEGQIVPPNNMVKHDEEDPYLVVAADKGTASFSDIANTIAKEYDFWLGDAFASGGSAGYDHKKMGITARGAWESVKRHFRQLGIDTQQQTFTVIGIGDMFGDVFGNGLLLSQQIKLVGAFNHQHLFLDPNPNPERSFYERQRLFQLSRSSWLDYDTRLISTGGGVFSRTQKSIPLSIQVQIMLGVTATALTPNELIRALLCAPVDLLWNGGIGTYVKAQIEHHIEVGDRMNDALRVNGQDLRCRVVGEGGNLGFTQLGRIEYARHGGRIHTDAIDNSGGVDCSDHEVNIKILLNTIVAEGDLTTKQRDQLLAEMTSAVAHRVLKNNYLQTQILMITQAIAPQLLDLQTRFIRHLEKHKQLDRQLEYLPNDKMLAERHAAKEGLTLPELCVLLAYSKITLYNELLHSDLLKDPLFKTTIESYFPAPLPARFATQIAQHRLRREIIATQLTNQVINRGGLTFIYLLNEDTGQSAPDIIRAFQVAWEIFDLETIWSQIEALDNQIEASVQIDIMITACQHLERATRWLLRHHRMPLDIVKTIANLGPGIRQLNQQLSTLISPSDQETLEQETEALTAAEVPLSLATQMTNLVFLLSALDIVEVANTTHIKLEEVAKLYFALGTRLKLYWLSEHISELPRDNRWSALSRSTIREELYRTHRQLTTVVLQQTEITVKSNETIEPEELIDKWMAHHQPMIDRCQQVLSELNRISKPDLSMLLVAVREIRNLL